MYPSKYCCCCCCFISDWTIFYQVVYRVCLLTSDNGLQCLHLNLIVVSLHCRRNNLLIFKTQWLGHPHSGCSCSCSLQRWEAPDGTNKCHRQLPVARCIVRLRSVPTPAGCFCYIRGVKFGVFQISFLPWHGARSNRVDRRSRFNTQMLKAHRLQSS